MSYKSEIFHVSTEDAYKKVHIRTRICGQNLYSCKCMYEDAKKKLTRLMLIVCNSYKFHCGSIILSFVIYII